MHPFGPSCRQGGCPPPRPRLASSDLAAHRITPHHTAPHRNAFRLSALRLANISQSINSITEEPVPNATSRWERGGSASICLPMKGSSLSHQTHEDFLVPELVPFPRQTAIAKQSRVSLSETKKASSYTKTGGVAKAVQPRPTL